MKGAPSVIGLRSEDLARQQFRACVNVGDWPWLSSKTMDYSSLATFATHPPLRHASDGRPDSARTAPRDGPYRGALLGADIGAF